MSRLRHSRDLVDFLRPPTGRCLGAVFLSYDFDEVFFESVLATLLPIHADPDTDPDRFVDEGRRRLRETPVAVLIDGYRARGGHRLPFDLSLAPLAVAFHPKLSLTLFEDHARLMLGSANLSEGGYGGNAELVAQLELHYGKDAALIGDVRAFIVACGIKGEAWDRIAAQLDLLVMAKPSRAKNTRLLHSVGERSPIAQLLATLPKTSKIVGVSLLLGMQPEDDPVAETEVLDHLLDGLAKRSKHLPPFELGLPWEGNPVSSPAEASAVDVDALFGQLCARFTADADTPGATSSLAYLMPLRADGEDIVCQLGDRTIAIAKRVLQAELGERRFWPLPEVVGVGPVASIERVLERTATRFFVFPELRLAHGQVFRRALHAKLLAVRTTEGKRERTHLLIGAPNFERFADEANRVVEAALHEVRDGHLTLESLSAELVAAPVEQLYLQNRPLPAPTPLHLPPLEEAIYDAHTRALVMTFRPGTKDVQVFYQTRDNERTVIDGEPRLREHIADFALDRHSAELRVDVGEESWLVPISFRHLPELVCDEAQGFSAMLHLDGALHFWDFVDLLCGRHELRNFTDDLPEERVAPQRVFRAIAVLTGELAGVGAALGAFEVAYRGPSGLLRFAECWLADIDTLLDRSEAWLYGQELARALGSIRFKRSAADRYKQRVIAAFISELEQKLGKLSSDVAYMKTLERFYRGAR